MPEPLTVTPFLLSLIKLSEISNCETLMYVIVPVIEKLVASSSLTNSFFPIVTLLPTNRLEFILTSPPTTSLLLNKTSLLTLSLLFIDTSPTINNLLFNETSSLTINLAFIEMSPFANIRMRSTASPLVILPVGAV